MNITQCRSNIDTIINIQSKTQGALVTDGDSLTHPAAVSAVDTAGACFMMPESSTVREKT